ncbi:MAG: DUF5799 family protein [Halanaeroarchaeum sp.]
MTDDAWQDRIVGARMTVDDEFADRVEASSFSRQQWSLVMTAAEFELRDAEDPDRARIVANTDNLDAILPELDEIERQMGGMAGGSSGDESGGGLLGTIKNALGIGGAEDVDESQRAEAAELVQAYADALQQHLEETGRWEEVRSTAAAE